MCIFCHFYLFVFVDIFTSSFNMHFPFLKLYIIFLNKRRGFFSFFFFKEMKSDMTEQRIENKNDPL